MRSDKQNQASKTNGKKSKGPVTEAGKANSAQNANTHNLCSGHLILLSNDDPAEFHHHQVAFLQRFQPIDLVEYDLVQKLIGAAWRERRVASMETALFEIQMNRQKHEIDREFEQIDPAGHHYLALFNTTDASAASGLLTRYAAAARRAYASALRLLKELQGDRFNRTSRTVTIFAPPEDLQPLAPHVAGNQQAGHSKAPEPSSEAAAATTPGIAQAIRVVRRFPLCVEPPFERNTRDNHPQNDEIPNEPETRYRTQAVGMVAAA